MKSDSLEEIRDLAMQDFCLSSQAVQKEAVGRSFPNSVVFLLISELICQLSEARSNPNTRDEYIWSQCLEFSCVLTKIDCR